MFGKTLAICNVLFFFILGDNMMHFDLIYFRLLILFILGFLLIAVTKFKNMSRISFFRYFDAWQNGLKN